MKTVNMHEAKSTLSALIRDIGTGAEAEVIICLGGKAAARIVPFDESAKRGLGVDRGLIAIAPDFDAMNPRIAALLEGAE